MTHISTNEVKQLANRIKIAMTDQEAESYVGQLSEMIEFVNVLKEVDTENVAPTTHPLQLLNVLREDVPANVLDREVMLESVKEHEDGQIKVPAII